MIDHIEGFSKIEENLSMLCNHLSTKLIKAVLHKCPFRKPGWDLGIIEYLFRNGKGVLLHYFRLPLIELE